MKPSHLVLKKAIDRVGVKAAAAHMKLSTVLLYKWCQEKPQEDNSSSGAANPLDRIHALYTLTKDPQLINWICQMADGFFVENTSVEKLHPDARVFKSIQKFIKEFSETLDTISDCYYNDSRFSEKEVKKIREEWEDLKRIGEGFVKACESGKFENKKGIPRRKT